MDRYQDAVWDLLEVRADAGPSGREVEAVSALVRVALREVRTCWAPHFGEPPRWR